MVWIGEVVFARLVPEKCRVDLFVKHIFVFDLEVFRHILRTFEVFVATIAAVFLTLFDDIGFPAAVSFALRVQLFVVCRVFGPSCCVFV